jgi:peptidyl-prolyl cis-trans isomerase B (cyclophilin B)
VVLVFVAAIVLVVVSGSSNKGVSAKVAAQPVSTFQPGNVCTYTADAATKGPSYQGFPPDTKATGQHTLTIKLSQGTIVIKLNPKAPCTINSFQFLAGRGFFTNTICHRLTTSGIYVLQCGDPTGTGSGGPGYTIPDENLTGATYPAGTVAASSSWFTKTLSSHRPTHRGGRSPRVWTCLPRSPQRASAGAGRTVSPSTT